MLGTTFFRVVCRAMAVLEPLKVTVLNFPSGGSKKVQAPNFPADLSKGHHELDFGATLYIEKSDFKEVCTVFNI